MKQELYINGQKADITNDNLIIFTYQQSDYSNPTSIKNSYTKSVTLPGTKNNNKIFNEIYRFDYQQNELTFNPSKRVQFCIYSNGTILEQGYLKLTKINIQGDYKEYSVSLYGGLGDFMYSLQYNDDGEKLTMSDIILADYFDLDFTMSASEVANAWARVNGDTTKDTKWDYINFAPCYNGIPDCDNFDPSMIAVQAGYYNQYTQPLNFDVWASGSHLTSVPYTKTDDGITYYPYTSTNVSPAFGIFTSENDLDEWQVNDHRCWLQRPVFSVKFLFKCIELYLREKVTPSFSINFDETWFCDQNPYWSNLWITLPLLYENNENMGTGTTITMDMLFSETKTPYDYLTTYTKSFGLWYDYDTTTFTVNIKPKYSFYNREIKDISNQIDTSSIKIDPLSFSSRTIRYNWENGEDDKSEDYEKNTGEVYGSYSVNTGYMFDNSVKSLPDNQIMKSAIDVRGTDTCYTTLQLAYKVVGRTYEVVPWWMWGNELTYTLYDRDNVENTYTYENVRPYPQTATTASYTRPYQTISGTLAGDLYTDGVAKPYFCDAENKSVDGDNVFLLYTGKEPEETFVRLSGDTTYDIATVINHTYVSDDIPGIEDITDGKQIWINTVPRRSSTSIYKCVSTVLPKFQRMLMNGKTVQKTLDYGKPAQTFVYSDIVYDENCTISRQTFTDKYLSDLYDVNTRILETKMKINDPKQAMHTVFYFGNSYWVINKITDYSYETNLTTVQFIKVNDLYNYIVGFEIEDSEIQVVKGTSSNELSFIGGDLNLTTARTDSTWITPVVDKTSNKLYIYITETNTTGSDRTGYVYFIYNTITRKVKVIQSGT